MEDVLADRRVVDILVLPQRHDKTDKPHQQDGGHDPPPRMTEGYGDDVVRVRLGLPARCPGALPAHRE
jgi:hypothetical protein